MKKIALFLLSMFCSELFIHNAQATSFNASSEVLHFLQRLPLQSGGRIKPLDTFARDSVLFISEKRCLENKHPLLTLFEWIDDGESWSKKEFIPLRNEKARHALGLPLERRIFSPVEIVHAAQHSALFRNVTDKQRRNIKLNDEEQALTRVLSKIELFQAIVTGQAWALTPASNRWHALSETESFQKGIAQPFASVLKALKKSDNKDPLDASRLLAERQAVLYMQLEKNPQALLTLAGLMNREVHFNELRPFQKSWIFYLVAALIFIFSFQFPKNKYILFSAWGIFSSAFLLHSYGIVLRCLLTGRPPVTNMYESTIWVPWGVIFFAGIISLLSRKHSKVTMIPTAASVVAVLSLVLADNIPSVLDPSIKPLEPVLRSNYWLTIHVLTITLSYAAFALSLGLGNIVLWLYLKKPRPDSSLAAYSLFMYRAVQFGVVLLAAGTILGGVWADYSWGRFWGWDPKETWALTALLAYIAVLHGKWAGWLKQFGIAVGTVLCFLGVLMAWYGVNFVLGVGLHSYGFTSGGGLSAVACFILLQLTFVLFVVLKVKRTRT